MIHYFSKHISLTPPERFTYPFQYVPHPLAIAASNELQGKLEEWGIGDDFIGKMFGVLIVKDHEDKLGFLTAYSGNSLPAFESDFFVPSIVDIADENGYFRQEEKQLSAINAEVTKLKRSDAYTSLVNQLAQAKSQAEEDIQAQRSRMKANKEQRQHVRAEAVGLKDEKHLAVVLKAMSHASSQEKKDLKCLKSDWNNKIEALAARLQVKYDEIAALKAERKQRSAALQEWLFAEYKLLNAHGQLRGVDAIFKEDIGTPPPAATGDCAAPRLVQFAFENHLQPICMAEFWWGQSPKTILRRHGQYYPSCTSKCKPILGHMLQGLDVDDNPLKHNDSMFVLDMVFEDDDILVVNKPAGILSVPGKDAEVISLYEMVLEKYPSALTVHRLDMATSGLLMFAKNAEVHKLLQAQFANRQVKKRYVAILDGIVEQESGKIELPLRVDLDNRPQQMVCYEHGKPSTTLWRVVERTATQTRIHFFPITGRTHQLRVHAAHALGLNIPIVGDTLYGVPSERLCLHAEALEFIHPTTGKKIRLTKKCDF